MCLSIRPSVRLSLSLSLSLCICGVVLADQGSQTLYRAFQVFWRDSKSVPFPFNLCLWKLIILVLNYASFIRNHYPILRVIVRLTSCWFSSALIYAPLHHKWTCLHARIQIRLFIGWGDTGSKYRYKFLYWVSLASRWWPNIHCWLGSFVIFQGFRSSIAMKP